MINMHVLPPLTPERQRVKRLQPQNSAAQPEKKVAVLTASLNLGFKKSLEMCHVVEILKRLSCLELDLLAIEMIMLLAMP